MYDFLLSYGTLDEDAEVNEEVVTNFLIYLLGSSVDDRVTASKTKLNPYIIIIFLKTVIMGILSEKVLLKK